MRNKCKQINMRVITACHENRPRMKKLRVQCKRAPIPPDERGKKTSTWGRQIQEKLKGPTAIQIIAEADCPALGLNSESGTLKPHNTGFSQENRGQAPPISVLPGFVKARYANETRGLRPGERLRPRHRKNGAR